MTGSEAKNYNQSEKDSRILVHSTKTPCPEKQIVSCVSTTEQLDKNNKNEHHRERTCFLVHKNTSRKEAAMSRQCADNHDYRSIKIIYYYDCVQKLISKLDSSLAEAT